MIVVVFVVVGVDEKRGRRGGRKAASFSRFGGQCQQFDKAFVNVESLGAQHVGWFGLSLGLVA